MAAYVNYPLTASDDDEFFDAPAGSKLLRAEGDGSAAYTRLGHEGEGWSWQAADGSLIEAGQLWASFFADGNPFGDYGLAPGWVLRVPLEWATGYGIAVADQYGVRVLDREAQEREAEARVAAWMRGA